MSTGWTLEGVDLRTKGINIVTVDGWDSFPRKRGKNVDVQWTDGQHTVPRKYFTAREIPLRLLIMDTDATGLVTHPGGKEGHLRENIDDFLYLLYKRDGLLDLRKKVIDAAGGTHQRQAMVEVLEYTPLEEWETGTAHAVREAHVRFDFPAALWNELPLITDLEAAVVADTHAFNLAVGGNAPVRDFIIEWTANAAIVNPRLTHDASGEYVQYSGTLDVGEVLTIDLKTKTGVIDGTTNAASGLNWGHAWWLELNAKETNAMTATVTSASDFDLEIRRYDKWF